MESQIKKEEDPILSKENLDQIPTKKSSKEKNLQNKANSDTEAQPHPQISEDIDEFDCENNLDAKQPESINQKNIDNSISISSNKSNKKKIKIGICAMEKKVSSKPMKAIIEKMKCEDFEITIFEEKIIFEQDIKVWPIVDVFISWYSEGFPLKKAQKYAKLRNPFLINDLDQQEILWDRFQIYKRLKKANINLPKFYFVKRNTDDDVIKNQYLDEEKAKLGDVVQKEPDYWRKKFKQNNTNEQNGNKEQQNQSKLTYDSQDEVDDYSRKKQEKEKQKNSQKRRAKSLEQKRKKTLQSKEDIPSSNGQTDIIGKQDQQVNENNHNKKKNKYYYDIEEFDDYIMIDDQKLKRPFVEKPQDAENHNIYIYYHQQDGGGCKKLFRKIDNKSSEYDKKVVNIRSQGNFIYEEFLPTNGFDIKVYTVGPDYVHAEARKAPSLDGRVQRTASGKEVRYPVALTPEEKIISRKIVEHFGQLVCGFDLLRSNGKSYVCDVNGWSFVKGNEKYYQDAGYLLMKIILERFGRKKQLKFYQEIKVEQSFKSNKLQKYRPVKEVNQPKRKEELRTIVAIFRHGDRTPKQKMKMKIQNEKFTQFYLDQIALSVKQNGKDSKKTDESKKKKKNQLKELKFKTPKVMEKFLTVTKEVKKDIELQQQKKSGDFSDYCFQNNNNKNDNIQQQNNINIQNVKEEQSPKMFRKTSIGELDFEDSIHTKLVQMISVLQQHGNFEGINRKIQIKPLKTQEIQGEDGNITIRPTSLLIILKFGGDLTHAGAEQALQLGHNFRYTLYPVDKDGLIRLHNTYRHDLKTYTSDEGRCQKTAGEFLKGMLELEGDTAPIMATLLTRNTTAMRLLDQNRDQLNSELQNQLKQEISQILNSEEDLLTHYKKRFNQETNIDQNMKKIMEKIGNPKKKLIAIDNHIQELTASIFKKFTQYFDSLEDIYYIVPEDFDKQHEKIKGEKAHVELKACDQESLIVLYKRWKKLSIDFYDKKTKNFNISKIPDIYDSIKYDMIHNKTLFQLLYTKLDDFYYLAEEMAQFVVPNEFGITEEERLQFAMELVSPLCNKIKNDLMWWKKQEYQEDEFWKYSEQNNKGDIKSSWRHIRTRLYFTSASHLYSLYNVLHLGLESMMIEKTEYQEELAKIKSLQYLSHIVFRLYEDLDADENDQKRFRLELSVSPGCVLNNLNNIDEKSHKVSVSSLLPINMQLSIQQVVNFFDALETGTKLQEKDKEIIKSYQDLQKLKKKGNNNNISPVSSSPITSEQQSDNNLIAFQQQEQQQQSSIFQTSNNENHQNLEEEEQYKQQ